MSEYKLRYVTAAGITEEVVFPPTGNTETQAFSISSTKNGDRNTVKVTAKEDVGVLKCTRRGVAKADFGDLCFINGYQSWTKTKEFFLSEKERDAKKIFKPLNRIYAFDRYGDSTFFNYDKHLLHGYDVFYVKKDNGAFILNANVKNAYLVVIVDKRTGEISIANELEGLKLKKGETFTVSDYYLTEGYEKGLSLFDSVYPERPIKKLLGYTSWYNYYQNINDSIIKRDLEALDERFDLFQIDDGYETFVGDWMDVDKKKFPDGLKPIVDRIHQKGHLAGIWLAPFVAEGKSKVISEHPDWFTINGERVKCGSNWSGFYAIDLYNDDARAYVKKCLEYFIDLGFDFYKLDFLYAVNLQLRDGMTRSQVAEYAYSFLSDVLKDKMILGCGATLFNAAGKFDYMRIGPDVSLKFDDVFYMRLMHNERISTKVTLQNTIYRSLFDGRLFGNDPDVFLLRDNNISMSAAQRSALLTLNALFGSVIMTSDNIAEYDQKKKTKLTNALDLFKNAKVTGFKREHDVISIAYLLNGEDRLIKYDYKKGILL